MLVRDGTSRCQAHKVLAESFSDKRRGSRQSRGYGKEWDVKRTEILRRDLGIFQPRIRDGQSDDDSNLQTMCADRHRLKTAEEAARGRRIR